MKFDLDSFGHFYMFKQIFNSNLLNYNVKIIVFSNHVKNCVMYFVNTETIL